MTNPEQLLREEVHGFYPNYCFEYSVIAGIDGSILKRRYSASFDIAGVQIGDLRAFIERVCKTFKSDALLGCEEMFNLTDKKRIYFTASEGIEATFCVSVSNLESAVNISRGLLGTGYFCRDGKVGTKQYYAVKNAPRKRGLLPSHVENKNGETTTHYRVWVPAEFFSLKLPDSDGCLVYYIGDEADGTFSVYYGKDKDQRLVWS